MDTAISRPNALARAKTLTWFAKGYLSYLLTGKHDKLSFLSMRELFCATNGRLNDMLALFHRATHHPYAVDTRDSIITGLDHERLGAIATALDRDGFYIFQNRLPDSLCDQLVHFALHTKLSVLGTDNEIRAERMRFEPDNPGGIKFDAEIQDIIQNDAAQRIVGDPGLLAIAQGYFRGKAMQDLIAMWWSAPGEKASSAAAQMYHFDMPRVKFLKFFIYLTDVDEHNGPHCFIAGSHRRLPKPLRKDKRHTDQEVFAHYPPEKRIEIKGPRGTICAVDTRGLHKGKRVEKGCRLMFQVEFAINLFGGAYPPICLNKSFSPTFLSNVSQYPYTFANYQREDTASPQKEPSASPMATE